MGANFTDMPVAARRFTVIMKLKYAYNIFIVHITYPVLVFFDIFTGIVWVTCNV